MTESHIPFEKLSSFFDEDIQAANERIEIEIHMRSCISCNKEFKRLSDILSRCASMRTLLVCRDGFAGKTMEAIKWRRRRKTFFRYIPAVAASVAVIGGFAIFPTIAGKAPFENSSVAEVEFTDTENIIGILSANDASILKISDMFIEGEIPRSKLAGMRRDLGFRKVLYDSPVRRSSNLELSAGLLQNYETVGVASSPGGSVYKQASEDVVHFKVFK